MLAARSAGASVRRLGGTILATWLLSLPALGDSEPAPGAIKVYGVHEPDIANLSNQEVSRLTSDLGAGAHRWVLDWQYVEPQAPQQGIHRYNFTFTDRAYAADISRGMKPLIVLMNAPKWAWGAGVPQGDQPFGMPPGPQHYDDWAALVGTAARRYPHALGFEVWNEPDAWAFWGRGVVPLDPVAYTRVLERAHKAIKTVDPCMPVVGGALASYPTTQPGVHLSVDEFVGGMIQAGAANHMDAISLHDYAVGPAPPDASDWTVPPDWMRGALARNGVKLPIWITESGVSTTGPGAVTEGGQAQSLVDLYRWFKSQADLDALFTHRLFERGINPLERGFGYGLIHQGTQGAKPAFHALKAAVAATSPQSGAATVGLQVSIPPRQKVIRRGRLRVRARCLSCCSVWARGRLMVKLRNHDRRKYRLTVDHASLRPGSAAVLTMRVRKGQRRSLRRIADQVRGRPRSRVTVVARDATGNLQRRKVVAKLKPKPRP